MDRIMRNSLLNLPEDVLATVYENLHSLKSIVRLDSALVSHALRVAHLIQLQKFTIASNSAYAREDSGELRFNYVSCVRWMLSRKITVQSIIIPNLDFPGSESNFAMPNLLSLHISNLRDSDWVHSIISPHTTLRTLELCGEVHLMAQALSEVSAHCPKLHYLTIRADWPVRNEVNTVSKVGNQLIRVLDYCPLRHIVCQNCELSPAQVAYVKFMGVPCIIDNCLIPNGFRLTDYVTQMSNMVIINDAHLCLWNKVTQGTIQTYIRAYHSAFKVDILRVTLDFDIYEFVKCMNSVQSLSVLDCTRMSAVTFTSLFLFANQLTHLSLCGNHTIEQLTQSLPSSNTTLCEVSIIHFTALQRDTVTQLANHCDRAALFGVCLPHLFGEHMVNLKST